MTKERCQGTVNRFVSLDVDLVSSRWRYIHCFYFFFSVCPLFHRHPSSQILIGRIESRLLATGRRSRKRSGLRTTRILVRKGLDYPFSKDVNEDLNFC